MARRATKGKVKVDFTNAEVRTAVAEGDKLVRVASAEWNKSGSGNQQLSFIFEVEKPTDEKGGKLYIHCPIIENSLWKLAGIMTALGVDVPKDELEVDADDLVDRKMMAVVKMEEYDGRDQPRIQQWGPASDYEGEDADEDSPKKSKKDKKGKKNKKAKDEPADEPVEEETSKKKDKKNKKDKKPKVEPIYEGDDITAMSEKKLQKLIDKHELDVDLTDHKTDRKKAGAVVDALEAAGLLKE